MPLRTFRGFRPKVHPAAYVHPTAELIGGVVLKRGASVWPYAVLRADDDRIVIGERSNIQDLAVIHCRTGRPTVLGRGVTVGHGTILHGCRIGDGCTIGMGSVVQECVIGRDSLIAAGAVVPPGVRISPRSLVMGVPGKVVRRLTRAEVRGIHRGEKSYLALSRLHRMSRVVG